MCGDVRFEYLNLARMAEKDDVICNDLTHYELNPHVCENVVLGLMI